MVSLTGCSTAIAFLDELQKIPIAGRHFDASESMLNAVSAAVVILIYFGIVRCVSRWRQNRQAAKIQ